MKTFYAIRNIETKTYAKGIWEFYSLAVCAMADLDAHTKWEVVLVAGRAS